LAKIVTFLILASLTLASSFVQVNAGYSPAVWNYYQCALGPKEVNILLVDFADLRHSTSIVRFLGDFVKDE